MQTYTSPTADSDTADLRAIALETLRDRYKPYTFLNSAFTVHDWVSAAENALEGDFDDLRYYLAEDARMEAECPAETAADYAHYMNDVRREDAMVAQWEQRA